MLFGLGYGAFSGPGAWECRSCLLFYLIGETKTEKERGRAFCALRRTTGDQRSTLAAISLGIEAASRPRGGELSPRMLAEGIAKSE